MILERAGTTRGGVYFHFETKQALAQAVLATNEQRSRALRAKHLTGSGLNGLIQYSHIHVHRLQHDPLAKATERLLLEEALFCDGHPQGHILREEWIADALSQSEVQEELREDVDVRSLTHLLSTLLSGVGAATRAGVDSFDPFASVDSWWCLLVPGVVKPARVKDIVTKPADSTKAAIWDLPNR